jgi:hypothetical protein
MLCRLTEITKLQTTIIQTQFRIVPDSARTFQMKTEVGLPRQVCLKTHFETIECT